MNNNSNKSFERRLDILIFAAHATRDFTVSDVFNSVFEAQRMTIRNCLKDLVDAEYLERTSFLTFKATDKAKQLFGATS